MDHPESHHPEPPSSNTQVIRLMVFVDRRAAHQDLLRTIQRQLNSLDGGSSAELEIVAVAERPYLAEEYKLVATPALVKTHPLPAQVLVGQDLATQLEVWWPRWQGQVALISNQADAAAQPPQATNAEMLRLSEELFALRQEKAELEEQLRFKDRILAMLAHDLRNPLAAVLMTIDTLGQHRQFLAPKLIRSLLNSAYGQAIKIDSMITDILEAARGTASELTLVPSEVQLVHLCQQAVLEVGDRLHQKQLTLQTDFPPQVPQVRADGARIRQVITNLLDNAIKYTPDGGLIQVQVMHYTAQKVEVCIKDTGPGIPEGEREAIFSDTVRLSRDHEQAGYGIGLSLCRRIIRAHYGRIWVDSPGGKGSSFHFTLPAFGN